MIGYNKSKSQVFKKILIFVSVVFLAVFYSYPDDTIFSDNFSGSYPGAWSIGHDGGGGNYAWAWPYDYAYAYADPYGDMYYYPNNLHVYMERRNVDLSGYTGASLSFYYIVDTEAYFDEFTVNVRDQSGNWHCLFTESGEHDLVWQPKTLNLDQFAGQSGLYIQFRFDSDGSVAGIDGPYDGVYVDNVVLTASGSLSDTYEPDNIYWEAKQQIPNACMLPHSIYPANDQDWVYFDLSSTSNIILETDGPAGDTRMWLYNAVLYEIAYDDDGGNGNFSKIVYSNLSAGRYYVKVDEYLNNDIIPEYFITLTVEDANQPPNSPTFQTVPSNGVYPTRSYSVTVDYTDPNGASNLQYVYLRLAQNNNEASYRQTLMWDLVSTPGQWSDETHYIYDLSASKTSITNGYRVTWNFKVNWSWNESNDVDLWAWALDDQNQESYHTKYNAGWYYENDIRIYSSSENKDPVLEGETYTVTGSITFEGTSLAPTSWSGISVEMRKGSVSGTLLNTDTTVSSGYSVSWQTSSNDVGTHDIYIVPKNTNHQPPNNSDTYWDKETVTVNPDLIPTRFRGDHFIDKTAKVCVPILLEAKLERDTFGNPDIADETVFFAIYFSGSWHDIGSDVTDSNGIGSVYYTPPKGFSPGNYSIRARFNGSGTYAPCELTRTLRVIRPSWILMYYLCNGDDNGMDDGLVVKFNTIANNLPNDNIEVLLLSDRINNQDYVFRMKNDLNVDNYLDGIERWTPAQIGLNGNEFDTGDVNTLNAFTNFVISNYEADHYALIIFNHGGGIYPTAPGTEVDELISGIGWDTNGDYLSISELGQGAQNVKNLLGQNLEILHLDACLMQMIEVNYQVINKVDYLIASENQGWYYPGGNSWESYLNGITSGTTSLALSVNIASSYFNYPPLDDNGRTISVADIGNVENVKTAVDNLANVLISHLSTIRPHVQIARDNVQKFAIFDDQNTMTRSNIFIDLRDFCEEIRDNVTVGEVITAASEVISAIGNTGGNYIRFEDHENSPGATATSGYWFDQGTYGVSIFFPETPLSTYRNYINDSSTPANLSFTASTHWDEFLTAYFGEVPPAAPSNLQATAVSPTQIDLVWEDNSDNETEFRIWRRIGNSGPFEWIGTMAADIEYFSDTGLLPNTTYQYVVHAHNDFGNSSDSNIAQATTPDTVPAAPSNLQAAVVSSTQINLEWDDNSNNEIGFKIERKTGPSGTYSQIGTTPAGVTTYQDTPLVPNTDYYYRVRAYNNIGNSLYSNEAHAKTPDTAPAAPTNLQASAVSSNQINLSWNDNSNNETGFKIERKTGSSGTYSQIDTVGAGTITYQDTQLTPETTYYYKVRAYNAVGDSTYSNEASATTQPCIVPPQPGGLSPCGGQMVPSPVTLSWNSVNGADSYKVRLFSGENCINFQQEIIVTPPSSSTGPISLPEGSYSWHVTAVNSCGETSSSCCNFQVGCPQPGVPTNPSPMNGATNISIDSDLDWDDCADVVSYDVYWGISYPPPYHGSTDASFYDLPQLEYGTQYFWKIVAKNACGDTTGADWDFTTEEYAMPHISSLNPSEGPIGTPVIISGSDFGIDEGTVTFNGVNAVVDSWSDTEIETTVPQGASTGAVVVHTLAGQDSNGVTFTVTEQPATKKADFDRDGNADVIWRYQGPEGYNAVWLSGNASSTSSASGISTTNEAIKGMNMGTGKPGLVLTYSSWATLPEALRHSVIDGFAGMENMLGNSSPSAHLEAMNRAMTTSVSDPRNHPQSVDLTTVADQNWKLAGTGDFNGDGNIDIVWSNVGTAHNCVWYMDGTTFDGYAQLPDGSTTDWVLGGVGDFDRDGNPDLIWHNVVDGRNGVWYLDGVQLKGIDIMTTGANVDWKLCGTGDFNNDGHVDLVWRNISDGRNAVWYMDGVELSSVGWLDSVADQNWKLRGTGDFNSDGKTDLIWTYISDGRNCIWYLDGVTLTGVEFLTTVTDTTWMIRNQ